jgi:hypothetical protein
MTIVSTGTDGDGEELGDADGTPDGEGELDGAGVSSGGPESTDGAVVGGIVGTWPSPPDDVHAAVATSKPDSTRAGSRDR